MVFHDICKCEIWEDSHGWEGEAEGGGLKSKSCLMVSFNERTKCRKT